MFPTPGASILHRLRDPDPAVRAEAHCRIAEACWEASYSHLRTRFRMDPGTAEDTVQGFFVRVIESDLLAKYEPSRGSFPGYLRRCLDNYAIDQHRRSTERRHTRALGDAELVGDDIGAALAQEQTRRILALAIERLFAELASSGRHVHAALFRMLYLDDERPTYQAAADTLGIRVTDATNWLHVARRELRRIVLEMLEE